MYQAKHGNQPQSDSYSDFDSFISYDVSAESHWLKGAPSQRWQVNATDIADMPVCESRAWGVFLNAARCTNIVFWCPHVLCGFCSFMWENVQIIK